jgi:hypothetical protein
LLTILIIPKKLVATEKEVTACPEGVVQISGSRVKLPIIMAFV